MVDLPIKAAINALGNQPEQFNHETTSTALARPSSALNENLKEEGLSIFDALAASIWHELNGML